MFVQFLPDFLRFLMFLGCLTVSSPTKVREKGKNYGIFSVICFDRFSLSQVVDILSFSFCGI